MILKHSYGLKLLCSEHLGPRGFGTEPFSRSTPCQKQWGVSGTHKLAKSNLFLFIATFFGNTTDGFPLCTGLHLQAPGHSGKGKRQVVATGCQNNRLLQAIPSHSESIWGGEGREEGVSVMPLSAGTDCPDHGPGSPVKSQCQNLQCWACPSECSTLCPEDRTAAQQHTICLQGLFLNPVL